MDLELQRQPQSRVQLEPISQANGKEKVNLSTLEKKKKSKLHMLSNVMPLYMHHFVFLFLPLCQYLQDFNLKN